MKCSCFKNIFINLLKNFNTLHCMLMFVFQCNIKVFTKYFMLKNVLVQCYVSRLQKHKHNLKPTHCDRVYHKHMPYHNPLFQIIFSFSYCINLYCRNKMFSSTTRYKHRTNTRISTEWFNISTNIYLCMQGWVYN